MNGTKQVIAPIDQETRAHVERVSKVRFKQSLVQGFAGPTIFGLVGAGGTALIAFATTNPIAWIGIGIIACAAVGALYFSSKLNSQVSQLDYDYQARQITRGINGPAPTIEQKPITFPAQSNAQSATQAVQEPSKPVADLSANKPTLVVDNVTNYGRTALPAPEAARGQA